MKSQFMILASVIAAASAGIGGLGGASGFAGIGGYSGGGNPVVFPNDGNTAGFNTVLNNGFGGLGVGGFSGSSDGGFIGGGFSANSGAGGYSGGGNPSGGTVRKFVSVFLGPEEPQITQAKVIRAGGATPDKHVNIIFVKAPSANSQQQTEVILPEPPQQKTLVYVLVKKQESSSNVRVRGPAPTRPSKPEVYFIRYKDGAPAAGPVGGGNSPAAYGPPATSGVGAPGGY